MLESISTLSESMQEAFSKTALTEVLAKLDARPVLPQQLKKSLERSVDACIQAVLADASSASSLPLLQAVGESLVRFFRIAAAHDDQRAWINVLEPVVNMMEASGRCDKWSEWSLAVMAKEVDAFSKCLRTLDDRLRTVRCNSQERAEQLRLFTSSAAARVIEWKKQFNDLMVVFLTKLCEVVKDKTVLVLKLSQCQSCIFFLTIFLAPENLASLSS